MKLAEQGSGVVAREAAEFIDSLEELYGEDAELTGLVLIAEVTTNDDEFVRWQIPACVTWAKAGGLATHVGLTLLAPEEREKD